MASDAAPGCGLATDGSWRDISRPRRVCFLVPGTGHAWDLFDMPPPQVRRCPDTRVAAVLGQLYFYSWGLLYNVARLPLQHRQQAAAQHDMTGHHTTHQRHSATSVGQRTRESQPHGHEDGEIDELDGGVRVCRTHGIALVDDEVTGRRVSPRRRESILGHAALPASSRPLFAARLSGLEAVDATTSDDAECWMQPVASLLAMGPNRIGCPPGRSNIAAHLNPPARPQKGPRGATHEASRAPRAPRVARDIRGRRASAQFPMGDAKLGHMQNTKNTTSGQK